jgi:hypothetical protein
MAASSVLMLFTPWTVNPFQRLTQTEPFLLPIGKVLRGWAFPLGDLISDEVQPWIDSLMF